MIKNLLLCVAMATVFAVSLAWNNDHRKLESSLNQSLQLVDQIESTCEKAPPIFLMPLPLGVQLSTYSFPPDFTEIKKDARYSSLSAEQKGSMINRWLSERMRADGRMIDGMTSSFAESSKMLDKLVIDDSATEADLEERLRKEKKKELELTQNILDGQKMTQAIVANLQNEHDQAIAAQSSQITPSLTSVALPDASAIQNEVSLQQISQALQNASANAEMRDLRSLITTPLPPINITPTSYPFTITTSKGTESGTLYNY